MLLALISDVHGNFPAFRAVLEHDALRNADAVYCLGDLVGYYPFPEECVRLAERRKIPCVMGNHDYACVSNKPCKTNELARKSLEVTRGLVSKQSVEFLSSLPKKIEASLGGKRFFLVHGSPSNPLDGYVYEEDAASVGIPSGFDVLAMGHTHRHFSRFASGKLAVNPGSVGQPREPSLGARFAVVDSASLAARFVDAEYDSTEVISKAEELGLGEAAAVLKKLGSQAKR